MTKTSEPENKGNEEHKKGGAESNGPKGATMKKRRPGVGAKRIAEASHTRIMQKLEEFRNSAADVYTFEANLTRTERGLVHMHSRKMGMRSSSAGAGRQRSVTVFRNQKIKTMKRKKIQSETMEGKIQTLEGKGSHGSLKFSEESKVVLLDLFMQYPPGQNYGLEQLESNSCSTTKKRRKDKQDDFFCKPLMNKAQIAKKVEGLSSRIKSKTHLKEIDEQRSRLPVASSRDVILTEIINHQVVLISGETGCGKTTQVPQYLLDKMWEAGEACKIICTQPRRISARSVAGRISYERGEDVGETIGYKIRLESKGGRHSSVVFCTNGVLLRVLVSNGLPETQPGSSSKVTNSNISEITHIIVDEIHERDHYSDFMLAILRDMLPRYPHLRLVLMSATMDAERFSRYFGDCPIVRVPGFTYPVKAFYLEDILSILKTAEENNLDATLPSHATEQHDLTDENKIAFDEAIDLAWSNDEFDSLIKLISSKVTSKVLNYQHSLTGISPLMVFAAKGRAGGVCMLLSSGADCNLKAQDGKTALDWAKCGGQTKAAEIIGRHLMNPPSNSKEDMNPPSNCKEDEQLVSKYLSTINSELVDVVLIEQLMRKICMDSKDGAILVFLPGWDDINRTKASLLAKPFFNDPSKFQILSLHSMVPPNEQKKVFVRPPPGCRKIILSTNIAETAITVDDVVYVIDSGRLKEKSYDPHNNVSTLQTVWVSKASSKQRAGRAGRCQPGFCYHLYTKSRAVSLPDFQIPEIKRMPIEELCLQVKMIDPDYEIEKFLEKTLDPPVSETIRNAIAVLKEIGALSDDENLTELGKKLGSLPVHPLTGKMLFFAILLNCLDPALTLACVSYYRDPFTLPMSPNEKKNAFNARAKLAALYGGHSDQLAVVAAFECWKNAKRKGQEQHFCSQYFISKGTVMMLSRMRKQLLRELMLIGYVPRDVSISSLNAEDPGMVRAVLMAGLYPRIGILHTSKNSRSSKVETASGDRIWLHHQSTLSFNKLSDATVIVYDEITRMDGGLQIRKCTAIGSLPLLLLANEIVVAPVRDDGRKGEQKGPDSEIGFEDDEKGKGVENPNESVTVIVDRWLLFKLTALEVAQIYCLRERLSAAIFFKAINPRKVLPPALGDSIYAISCILSNDGLSGLPLPSESMVDASETRKSSQDDKGMDQNPSSFLGSLFYPPDSKLSLPAGSTQNVPTSTPSSQAKSVLTLLAGSNEHAPTSKRKRKKAKKAKSVPSPPAGSSQHVSTATPSGQAKSVPSLPAGSSQDVSTSTPSGQAKSLPPPPAGSKKDVRTSTSFGQATSVPSLPAGSMKDVTTPPERSLPAQSNQHVPTSTSSSQSKQLLGAIQSKAASENLAGYGSGAYGPYGPRRASCKRSRYG